MPALNTEALIENRVQAIQAYHYQSGQQRAELDLSGGVDSAVMLGLLVRALGAENVTTIFLGINSTVDALERARECAATFGVKLIEFDGTALFQNTCVSLQMVMFKAGFSEDEIVDRIANDPTILGSIRSTLRAPWGRAVNRLSGGGIRHGTGNEDEDRFMRFYQKGGDGEVDTNPIAMLSKGEVFQLGIALGVPQRILKARPSPDLWGVGEAHNDEDEIAACLHLQDRSLSCYSYVDPETGVYKNVGIIERVSRYVDTVPHLFNDDFTDDLLKNALHQTGVPPVFKGMTLQTVFDLLVRVRHVERVTRHKLNPNCPSLGDRASLVHLNILSNHLPV